MTQEQIEDSIKKSNRNPFFEINFKVRSSFKGLFIKTVDFEELGKKNLWRIVNENKMDEFIATKDESLARIFNGAEFTRLVAQK